VVGVKPLKYQVASQAISIGNALNAPAVAQSLAKNSYLIERVRGMRNTSSMGTTKKSLAQTHPALAKEADGWDPKQVSAGSGKKVSWKCKKGHHYESTIGSRTGQGSGCPYCVGKKILPGFNDIKTTHPHLADEADGWDPTTIGAGSGKKVAWKCKLGHKWISTPNRRTSGNSSNCAVCGNKKILIGFNDLASTHPELAKETTKANAQSVTAGSSKQIEWKCSFKHKWSAKVVARVNGTGCPVCAGQKTVKGVNDLATKYPKIADQADGWDPTVISPGSRDVMPWKCIKGHTWRVSINSRTNNNSTCPYCSKHRVSINETDLKTKFPLIASEAVGWNPSEISAFSTKKYQWICPIGHEYLMAPANRTQDGQNCPICAGKQVLPGFNDLASKFPQVASEAHQWDPTTVTVGSKKKRKWKCKEGHVWEAVILNRVKGSGCGVCGNRVLEEGINDLATKFPEIAVEADGWNPREKLSGSSERLSWKCKEGHTWESTIVNRTFNLTGCPICINQQLLTGFNDLATVHPELAEQAHGWDPSLVLSGSAKKVEWICTKGHVWKSQIASRISQNSGCLVCIGRQVLAGYNDIQTTFPELASQAVGWDPTKYTHGSGAKVKWRCDKGHTWDAVISSRTTGGQGCPSCSVSGFDPNKEGWLYLLVHPDWELHQIGISNVLNERLKTHRNLGWVVVDTRGPLQGDVTYQWEQSIIRALKKAGAIFDAESVAGKFTGYSESWRKDSFPAEKLVTLMEFVKDMEERTK
jgi:Probable Zinc-ribbon domain